jgi:putative nucleotidyltransferase with HDIG domain
MSATNTINVEELAEISTIPVVVTKAIQILHDPKSSSRDLTDLIINDQVLAGKILKVANSAFYGLPTKINNLNRAILLIGFNEIKRMITPILLFDTFKNLTDNKYFSSKGFWNHSMAVAGACEILAEKEYHLQDIGEARIAGLLHDIGRLIVVESMTDKFEKLMKKVELGADVMKAETAMLGLDHAEIGARITKLWNLPRSVVNSIRFHHNPDQAGEYVLLAETVCFADFLANSLDHRSLQIGDVPQISDAIRKRFITGDDGMGILLTRLETEIERVKTFLNMIED